VLDGDGENIMGTIKKEEKVFEGGGIVLFEVVQDAMRAEKVLTEAGFSLKLVAPPPTLRMGCDLALEINLVEKPGIERVLREAGAFYTKVAPLTGEATAMMRLTQVIDFGKWTMVRAGNMKLCYEKATGLIVNESGGGCPDIPYLYAEMVDKKLDEVTRPRDLGFTLCARVLDVAYEKCLELYKDGH
jgi:hypothetical protein